MTLILDIKEDAKLRRHFIQGIVEDLLVKKPFVKVLAVELLTASSVIRSSESLVDVPRLAIECLKSLSSEDLRQLHLEQKDLMTEFETKYTDIQGNSLDNDLSKIVLRYVKEGKPQAQAPPQVKQ